MIITTTAISFTLLGFGLGFFGWRFLRAFQESNKPSSGVQKLLSLFLIASSAQNLVLGLGTFFFAQNPRALFYVFFFTQFLLAIHAALGIYTLYYLLFPVKSSFAALSLVILLGVATIGITVAEEPRAFLTASNGVEWDGSSLLASLTFLLLLISIGSFTYIFLRLFKNAATFRVKMFSSILAFAGVIGIASTFIRFILLQNAPGDAGRLLLDGGIAFAGILFLVALLASSLSKSPNQKLP